MVSLPEIVTVSGFIDLDGRDLSLEANAHLFQWPGELVFGSLQAFSGASPETVAPQDWNYRRLANPGGNERTSRRPPPRRQVPDVSTQELRDRVWGEERRSDAQPEPDIARPTLAGAFEQRLFKQDVYNPFLAEYPMMAIEMGVKDEPRPFEPTHYEGAQWACDWLCLQTISMAIMSPEVVGAIGAYNTGMVCCEYMLENHGYLSVASICAQLEAALENLSVGIEAKLSRIESEISLWASYGRAPVEQPNGSPEMLLSAADAATATIGVYRLANLAVYLQDWLRGAIATAQGVRDCL